MNIITTFEHAYLTQSDFPNPPDFDWLIEQNFPCFTIERKQGRWQLKVRHYLGAIGLPSGAQLEILPKISQNADIKNTRHWVQHMLNDTWHTLTPKIIPNLANQQPLSIQPNLPLSDWLIQHFWQFFQSYQPNQHYQSIEQNHPFLQGKLLLKQQLQHNAHQPHKFFHQTDIFITDTACNRLVKTALYTVISSFKPSALTHEWRHVTIICPPQYHASFTQAQQELATLPPMIATQNQDFINFCYTLLTLQQGTGQGQNSSPTILINMQFAFEKWVTLKIQQQFSLNNHLEQIVPQKSQALTADNSLTIKPDIWLKTAKSVQVCDIKWKNIATIKDITLADMYQLLTYTSEFGAEQAWLIVPTLDKTMAKQPIILAKPNTCQFWLMPFYVTEGVLCG